MPLLLFGRRTPGTGMDQRELVNLLDTALAIAADFGSPVSVAVGAHKLGDGTTPFPRPKNDKDGDDNLPAP